MPIDRASLLYYRVQVYGERFVMFSSEVLAEEGIFFLPDMAWYNVL